MTLEELSKQASVRPFTPVTQNTQTPTPGSVTINQMADSQPNSNKTPKLLQPAVKQFNPLGPSKLGQVGSGLLKGVGEAFKGAMSTSESLLKEKARQEIRNTPIGMALNTAQPLYQKHVDELLKFAKDKYGFELPKESLTEMVQSAAENKLGLDKGQLLKANTQIEKTSKVGAEIASAFVPLGEGGSLASEAKNLIPKGKSLAEKALSLTENELKNINGKKLESLSKGALSAGKTTGNKFTGIKYDISSKVKPLLDEFGHILTEKTPAKNIEKVKTFMKDTYNASLDLFKNNNPGINKTTGIAKLKTAIKNDPNAVYGKDLKEVSDKAVNKFLSFVKDGTAKGWEEARNKWYSEVKKVSDDKLSSANKALHDAIKKVITEKLPEESKNTYNASKQTVAKANDVMEILKAKNKTLTQVPALLKRGAQALGVGAGLEGVYQIGKRLLGK